MSEDERNALRDLIAALVGALRDNGVQPETIAAVFHERAEPDDMLTDDGVLTVVDEILEDARDSEPVMLSRDTVAQRFTMTPQGVSWHIKQGNLRAVRIPTESGRRLAIPLSSVCEYFGVSPHARDRMTQHLPRDDEGNIKPVFWDVSDGEGSLGKGWPVSEEMGE